MTKEKEIVEVAIELLAYFGQGDCSLNDAQKKIDVMFVMGAHHLDAALPAARLIAGLQREIPVIISGGGDGRGSWFLEQAVASVCLVNGRRPLSVAEKQCEATLLKRLFVDEGVPEDNIRIETKARHSRENFEKSLEIFTSVFTEFRLAADAVIGVVQSPLNRIRALHTGRSVLSDPRFESYGLHQAGMVTIDFPQMDLNQLSERGRVIELFRLFGLPGRPESELRVCENYCPAAIENMNPELKQRAIWAERQFHTLLEMCPSYVDYIRGALETMALDLGGIR
jgi:uncharacterized SAM-binding protein YcdF (DUF218 family)